MNWIVPVLILLPFVFAALLYFIRGHKIRAAIIYTGAVVMMVAVGILCVLYFANGGSPVSLYYETAVVDKVILGAELALMVFVTVLCFRARKFWIAVFSVFPTLLLTWFEFRGEDLVAEGYAHIVIDHMSLLMCVIVAVIGGLIAIYAAGYMHGYHTVHTEFKDRRGFFYAVMFIFMGSMYGFVLSSSLLWLDFFWEMTSVCSFLLIGYTKTDEAVRNSFRALWMNLLGGTILAIGIVYLGYNTGVLTVQSLVVQANLGSNFAIMAVACVAFAALTKSAQMPFSTWLLGAMVAPTPSSALLHSATMVKAGIYILFRLAPAMSGTLTGTVVAFVGGFTFLMASFMAIAKDDAKKTLAFSTISNLGLMVACAGMGTPETIWAGIFLMIFHAVSKSLLFQDVGAVENSIHSRNIEDMHGLIFRLPKLAIIMFIGIVGMYLAPFGMLIAKWSALRASIDTSNILMVFFICFGSATTAFYWTKWLGKLISHSSRKPYKDVTRRNEMLSLVIHSVLMVGLCVLYPVISAFYVDTLLMQTFGMSETALSPGILIVLIVIIIAVLAIPFAGYLYSRKVRVNRKLAYMNGINTGNNTHFIDSMGEKKGLNYSGFYFKKLFGEQRLMVPTQLISAGVLLVLFCILIGGIV